MKVPNGNYAATASGNQTKFKVGEYSYTAKAKSKNVIAIKSSVEDLVTVKENHFGSARLGTLHNISLQLN